MRAIACLLLGAATTISIAWAVAWRSATPSATVGSGKRRAHEADPDPFPLKWYVSTRAGFGTTWNRFRVDTGSELDDEQARQFESLASDTASKKALARHGFLLNTRDDIFLVFNVRTFGWPTRSFAYEEACTQDRIRSLRMLTIDLPSSSAAFEPDHSNDLAPTYGAWNIAGHLLPCRPLWRGLLLSMLIYAACWAVSLAAIRRVRRTFQRKPGQCPRCGYELEGLPPSSPCPECGATVDRVT